MTLNASALDAAMSGLSDAYPYVSLSNDGTTEVSTRVAANWADTGDGVISASNLAFTGLDANQAVSFVLLFSANTGGTSGGSISVTGDNNANAAGEFTISGITINVS